MWHHISRWRDLWMKTPNYLHSLWWPHVLCCQDGVISETQRSTSFTNYYNWTLTQTPFTNYTPSWHIQLPHGSFAHNTLIWPTLKIWLLEWRTQRIQHLHVNFFLLYIYVSIILYWYYIYFIYQALFYCNTFATHVYIICYKAIKELDFFLPNVLNIPRQLGINMRWQNLSAIAL